MRARHVLAGAVLAGILTVGCTDNGTTDADYSSDPVGEWATEHIDIIRGMRDALTNVSDAASANDLVALDTACDELGEASIDAATDTVEDMPPGFEDEWHDAIVAAAGAADACAAGDYAGASAELRRVADSIEPIVEG